MFLVKACPSSSVDHPMTELARVSVVIPVFNAAPFLEMCVSSVVDQSFTSLEILLVDDGSTDGSTAICEELCSRDSRISVIHTQHHGVAVARNTGIRASRGKYLAFVDSDDLLGPRHIGRLVQAASETGSQVAVGGFTRFSSPPMHDDNYGMHTVKVFGAERFLVSGHHLSPISTPSACSKIWLRTLWDGIDFPSGRLHEDAMVTHRVIRRAEQIAVSDQEDYFYRVRDNSITGSPPTPKYLADKARAHQIRAVDLLDIASPQLLAVEFAKVLRYTLLALAEHADSGTYDDATLAEINSLRQWLLHADLPSRSVKIHLALAGLRWTPAVAARAYARSTLR
jgi:glycosyltransferase involved in cell wall biosynthesis